MALTHKIVRRIDLAHEPGAWIEARQPSLAILDRAREARSRKAFDLMKGVDLSQLKGLTGDRQEGGGNDSEYDWQTILGACVTAWSYPEKVCPENVAELDGVTVQAVLAELLPKESESERKNG